MPKFEIHFHDKVGAQIAYVENFNATFDKDMNMQVLDANSTISKALNDLYDDVDEGQEINGDMESAPPASPLDSIFHRALNVAKVKKAIEQIVIMKGVEGKFRLSLKQWFVVHKVLEEISWLDDDTDTKFVEWIRDVYHYEGKTGNFKSVLAPFKHTHSTKWDENTVSDRQTGREYRQLADYVRSLFVTIGRDGRIEDKEEFMNLGSDGKPMYIGHNLREK